MKKNAWSEAKTEAARPRDARRARSQTGRLSESPFSVLLRLGGALVSGQGRVGLAPVPGTASSQLEAAWTHTVRHSARVVSRSVKPGLQLLWRRGNGAPAAGRDDSAFGSASTVLTAALGSPQSLTRISGSIKPMSGLRARPLSNSFNRAVHHQRLSSDQQQS